jgi:hypothetical protein
MIQRSTCILSQIRNFNPEIQQPKKPRYTMDIGVVLSGLTIFVGQRRL